MILAPAWIWKMHKRGGWGTGLVERLGIYDDKGLNAYEGADYYHAVSVGETIMALKVIKECQLANPHYLAVIAVTTATGHQVAHAKSIINTHIIYAPLDLPPLLKKLFPILKPRKIILVDSEIWPNLLHYADKHHIPVSVINGRISARSFERFLTFKKLVAPILKTLHSVCVDGENQVNRWHTLGVPDERIHDVGSLKFDFCDKPQKPNGELQKLLEPFGKGLPSILLSSTHPEEEALLVNALKQVELPFRLIVAPRHAERRDEVTRDLISCGYNVIKRTKYKEPDGKSLNPHALLIDTTGELSQWLQVADIVIMGKCWLKKGGQNPFESVILGKTTICGPYMDNFQPLLGQLVTKNGVIQISTPDHLAQVIKNLLNNPSEAQRIAKKGQLYLEGKKGAVARTTRVILN